MTYAYVTSMYLYLHTFEDLRPTAQMCLALKQPCFPAPYHRHASQNKTERARPTSQQSPFEGATIPVRDVQNIRARLHVEPSRKSGTFNAHTSQRGLSFIHIKPRGAYTKKHTYTPLARAYHSSDASFDRSSSLLLALTGPCFRDPCSPTEGVVTFDGSDRLDACREVRCV
jgi:hypothetical protein